MQRPKNYTKVPRTILWLVEGGSMVAKGPAGDTVEVESFYLSKFPITNLQYEAFDPSFERHHFSRADRDPALGLTWERAEAYCDWYAAVARKPMRLPTEEEWEWACRANPETGTYFHPDEADQFVWSLENTPAEEMPRLDKKASNPAGLWAMLGGVWEWMAARDEDDLRALRGGSYRLPRRDLVCGLRRLEAPNAVVEDAGFRVAKSLRSR